MNVQSVTFFLALLAVLAGVITIIALVSRLTGDRLRFLETIEPLRLELAAAIATTATLGSLYLSEGAGFLPCRLCWFQRGFMYPTAVLLVLAAVSDRTATGFKAASGWLVKLAQLLSLVGFGVAVFHRYEQSKGGIGSFCDPAVPCADRWMNHFGFMTIPTMAAVGFIAIAVLSFGVTRSNPTEV